MGWRGHANSSCAPRSAGPELKPNKLAVLATLTNELAQHSHAEAVVKQMLSESAALALDAKVFSTDAASDSVSPAGILAGVTPIVGKTGGGIAALTGDIKSLIAALAAAGAPTKISHCGVCCVSRMAGFRGIPPRTASIIIARWCRGRENHRCRKCPGMRPGAKSPHVCLNTKMLRLS